MATSHNKKLYVRAILLCSLFVSVCHAALFKYTPTGDTEPAFLLELDFTIHITAHNIAGTQLASFTESSNDKNDVSLFGVHGARSFLQLEFPNGIDWAFMFNKQSDTHVSLDRMLQFIPANIFPELTNINYYVMFNDRGETNLHSTDKSYACAFEVTTPYEVVDALKGNIEFKVSVTVSNFKVQAFNVKDGQFSPSVDCTSLPPTTLKPTTATPAPPKTTNAPNPNTSKPPPPPKPGSYLSSFIVSNKVGNDSTSCIAVEGKFSFEITYKAYISKYATMKKTISFGIPEVAIVEGRCHVKTGLQTLVVKFFRDWMLELVFSINYAESLPYENGDSQSKMDYSVKVVTFKYSLNDPNFPSAYLSEGANTSMTISKHKDLPRKRASNGFFQCNSEKRLQLNDDVALVMSDVKFKAFIADEVTSFYGIPDKCQEDVVNLASPPAVVVVGCLVVSMCLLAVVAVLTVIGVKCAAKNRRRRRKYYVRII